MELISEKSARENGPNCESILFQGSFCTARDYYIYLFDAEEIFRSFLQIMIILASAIKRHIR